MTANFGLGRLGFNILSPKGWKPTATTAKAADAETGRQLIQLGRQASIGAQRQVAHGFYGGALLVAAAISAFVAPTVAPVLGILGAASNFVGTMFMGDAFAKVDTAEAMLKYNERLQADKKPTSAIDATV
ncbi:MAG: hypothetical protein VKJ06_08300 [Vampirovibrionales bacterium]|nr:hypothetical protein [Vampirovibrionales bacterium]